MRARLHKVLLVLMLLVLPLQGTAAAVHAFSCSPEGAHAGAAAGHAHSGHHGDAGDDHGTAHHHPSDDGTAEFAGHQCCHHVSTATAPALLDVSAADLPVYLSSLKLLETLFYPEQPRRPPRG